ncbi:hypothetical protein MAPG_06696 [Magnaporthiopsis poae ATCC 64411]|uniref:Uncharacterized protein n=1 Tax=Magnaporthiopsis poae (strain ATCC 64411 / 73-15) TaxID=644358 RepID=A0A0C4E2Q6_MAGP6|nr:hypothetical protein MAPG_06696 [Magnaporthiopsis poae ATCC 64411]
MAKKKQEESFPCKKSFSRWMAIHFLSALARPDVPEPGRHSPGGNYATYRVTRGRSVPTAVAKIRLFNTPRFPKLLLAKRRTSQEIEANRSIPGIGARQMSQSGWMSSSEPLAVDRCHLRDSPLATFSSAGDTSARFAYILKA